MEYEKNYYDYINYVKTLNRIKSNNTYYEKHHILPKSLGGTDENGNIVLLTYREHYLAHYLLWKIFKNKQTIFAFWRMCNFDNSVKLKISSRLYEKAKADFLNATRKQVICLETEEIFSSLKEAAIKNNLKDGWSIRIAIEDKEKTANGYHWDDYNDNFDYTKNIFYGEKSEYFVVRLEDAKKYKTLVEAGIDNKKSKTTILDAITGKCKTANGYHWSKYIKNFDYTKTDFYGKEKVNILDTYKKVICVETGKFYVSQSEAARDIRYKVPNDIGRCCKGKLKTCGGFHWKYYEN